MVTHDNRELQSEPDPKWRPLADTIFFHTHATTLDAGQCCFTYDFQWSNTPASIELGVGSRTFKLTFNDGRAIEALPWELLKGEKLPLKGLPKIVALNAVRSAWLHMQESFASAISQGQYKVFARLDDFRAPFAALPRDHWRLYRVTDWSTGVAIAPDGQQIWSIHCESVVKPQSGRKPVYDQDQVDGEVRRLFRQYGPIGSGKEPGWQTHSDLQERIAQFLFDTSGQSPAKSTLQHLVKRALEAVKAETA
jgi:hypothetical protein